MSLSNVQKKVLFGPDGKTVLPIPITLVNSSNALTYEGLDGRNDWLSMERSIAAMRNLSKNYAKGWFFRVRVVCDDKQLKSYASVLPSLFRHLNQSRRLRRIGVDTVRLANDYVTDSGAVCFITDGFCTDMQTLSLIALPLAHSLRCGGTFEVTFKVGRSNKIHLSVVEQRKFMRPILNRINDLSKYYGSLRSANFDVVEGATVRFSFTDAVPVGVFDALLQKFGDSISYITFGRGRLEVAPTWLLEDNDYKITTAKWLRSAHYRRVCLTGRFFSMGLSLGF